MCIETVRGMEEVVTQLAPSCVSLSKGVDFHEVKFSSKMFLMFIFVCYVDRPM